MKRPITWRKKSSVRASVAYTPTRRRGTSTPSETISTDTSHGAEPAEKRAIRADASGASECTMSGRSPVIRASRSASLSACSLSIATTSATGVRVIAAAQHEQLLVARRAGRG